MVLHAVEAEPAVAAQLFADRIDLARRFTGNLAAEGEPRGLIGPLELPRLWTRHIVNCALVAPLLRAGGLTADIGSGGGLPGLVLAIARPDVRFLLVEPMERRVAWLEEQVAALGLEHVEVRRARGEDVAGIGADQVTARAVGALAKLIPLVAPVARPGGELVLMKGAAAEREIAAAAVAARRARLLDLRVDTLGAGLGTEETRVVRATIGSAE